MQRLCVIPRQSINQSLPLMHDPNQDMYHDDTRSTIHVGATTTKVQCVGMFPYVLLSRWVHLLPVNGALARNACGTIRVPSIDLVNLDYNELTINPLSGRSNEQVVNGAQFCIKGASRVSNCIILLFRHAIQRTVENILPIYFCCCAPGVRQYARNPTESSCNMKRYTVHVNI